MWRALLTLVGLSLVTIAAVTSFVQGHANTFHKYERWITSKSFLEVGAIGGVMFRVSRVALAGDRVDFGTWFGFHEILWDEPVALAALEFDFELEEDAWMAVLFNGKGHSFDFVRFSRLETRPAAVGRVDRKRTFTALTTLDGAPPNPAGWHTARIEFEDFAFRVFVDGEPFVERSLDRVAKQRFGFKAGGANARLDNVRIEREDGSTRLEHFTNHRGRRMVAASSAAGLLGVHALIAVGLWLGRRRLRRSRLVYHLAFAALAVLATGSYYFVDRMWFATRYPADVLSTPDYPNTITFEPDPVPPPPQDGDVERYRIVVVGSSQTWGSGAALKSDTWVARLEAKLNERSGGARWYECVNTGISGATSTTLWPRYRDEWVETRPNMTIIDLGHNDLDVGQFGMNLARITELNRKHGIRTVFLLEPNSRERSTFNEFRENLAPNHLVMRKLGDQFGIAYVDMQAKMDARRDDGFLWWDLVHMTSAGHEIFAEELVGEILELAK